MAQVTGAVVKTQGRDLEIQEDHGVVISLTVQQKGSQFQNILLHGRQSCHTPSTGSGKMTEEGTCGVRALALGDPAHDSQCGF